jgi:hypothetical protein
VRRIFVFSLALALGACGYTHRFEVRSDDAIQSGIVELNGKTARLQVRDEHLASGELAVGADADGRLVIHHKSGTTTICPIGYVTQGEQEPHQVTIERGKCTWQING